jgi:hypothetical protein
MRGLFLIASVLLLLSPAVKAQTDPAPPGIRRALAYPNPAWGGGGINVIVNLDGGPQQFELVVFDAIGRRIATVYRDEGNRQNGSYSIHVDGRDIDTGEPIPPGYYFLAMIDQGELFGAVRYVLTV